MSSSPCPDCTQPLQIVAEHCPHCARPGRYPNVLLASQAADVAALDDRLQKAEARASARGAATNVQDFSAALADSKAVIARPRGELERLASNDNQVYATYYQLIDAEARVPDDDKWDALRRGTDEALFPGQKEKVRFAALTLDAVGVLNYGACQMTLRAPMIAHRASVFEENTAAFMEKHEVKLKDAPASAVGFRAPWGDRAKVCVAKLADEITPATTQAMRPGILLHQGATSAEDRFVEVHIWGPMTIRSFERVVFLRSKDRKKLHKSDEKVLHAQLAKLGVGFEVRP
jgi:hypothetical protein